MPGRSPRPGVLLAVGSGVAAGAYLATVAVAWSRFGHHRRAAGPADERLDALIPQYDVAERHQIQVAAPVDVTFAAARDIDMTGLPLVRAIIKGREWIMRSTPARPRPSRGFVADMQAIGWGLLADEPGHEIVMGGVTRPWDANPTFRAIPADQFRAFAEPGLVKIAFTLRVDPTANGHAIFRTETRAVATDAAARQTFRTYWAFLSPGIVLIRWALLRPLKREAERRFHAAR